MGSFTAVDGRFWRMLSVKWQRAPLESGAHLYGGRLNRIGQPALYLAVDHSSAIAEFHRPGVRPGTLAAFDLVADRIVDLTDPVSAAANQVDQALLALPWHEQLRRGETPPTWPIVDRLIADGAQGALYPSQQRRGGVNLVLWQWYDADAGVPGAGAAVRVIDPERDLR